jgi:hypothetical protein
MTLDYTEDRVVKIDMRDYIDNKVLDGLPERFDGTATTPAAEHLFKVRDEATPLGEEDSDFFHSMVAKLLFLCKRGRR